MGAILAVGRLSMKSSAPETRKDELEVGECHRHIAVVFVLHDEVRHREEPGNVRRREEIRSDGVVWTVQEADPL
jgi:hypothetical protein